MYLPANLGKFTAAGGFIEDGERNAIMRTKNTIYVSDMAQRRRRNYHRARTAVVFELTRSPEGENRKGPTPEWKPSIDTMASGKPLDLSPCRSFDIPEFEFAASLIRYAT